VRAASPQRTDVEKDKAGRLIGRKRGPRKARDSIMAAGNGTQFAEEEVTGDPIMVFGRGGVHVKRTRRAPEGSKERSHQGKPRWRGR